MAFSQLWTFILSVAKNPHVRQYLLGFFKKKDKDSDPPLHIAANAQTQAFSINHKKVTTNKNSYNFSLITVNVNKCNPKGKSKVKSGIKELVQGKNYRLLEKKASDSIAEIKRNEASPAVQNTLSILRDIVPAADLPIIRASLFLRKKFLEKKKAVPDLKEQINLRYGQRGARISNLVCAGYYDEMIIPLYEKMKADAGYTREAFEKIYETIIAESAYAVFVNVLIPAARLKKIIYRKIISNKRYGTSTLNIHGIGKNNIEKVETVCNEITKLHSSLKMDEFKIVGETVFVKIGIATTFNPEDFAGEL